MGHIICVILFIIIIQRGRRNMILTTSIFLSQIQFWQAWVNLSTVCALIYGKQQAMMHLSYSCAHNALHWAAFMRHSGQLLTSCLRKLQLCLALTSIPLPQRDTCKCIMQQIFAHTVKNWKCIEAGCINMAAL